MKGTETYERKRQWTGVTIHKAKTGFVVEFRSQIQGTRSGDKYLIPYGEAAGGYDETADLWEARNEFYDIGQYLAEFAIMENPKVRTLRKGDIVQ